MGNVRRHAREAKMRKLMVVVGVLVLAVAVVLGMRLF